MGASFDSRDHRHAFVSDILDNLNAFIMNLAPNAGIGNVAHAKSIPGMNSPRAPVRITILFARSCAIR
jgi:hypothetical protein